MLVRRGFSEAEVWLDADEVALVKPSRFPPRDEKRVLSLVDEHLDHLFGSFMSLKNDVRCGRLERNVLVD